MGKFLTDINLAINGMLSLVNDSYVDTSLDAFALDLTSLGYQVRTTTANNNVTVRIDGEGAMVQNSYYIMVDRTNKIFNVCNNVGELIADDSYSLEAEFDALISAFISTYITVKPTK